MALTISTGFVVDDAIVVLENITRHLEDGRPPFEAALAGAREIGFTVLSMSVSLVAVFIPLLFMGGLVGPALPRVRGDPVGGRRRLARDLADDDADAVRAVSPKRAATAGDGAAHGSGSASERARLRAPARRLRPHAGLGARAHGRSRCRCCSSRRAERLSFRGSCRRASSRSRTTACMTGHDSGVAGHVVSGDAADSRRRCPRLRRRSGRRHGRRVHRRRHGARTRRGFHLAEAARGRRGASADQVIARLAPGVRARSARQLSTCRRRRTSASAAGRRTRSTSTRCRATSLEYAQRRGRRGSSRACGRSRCVADVNTDQQNSGPRRLRRHRPRHGGAAGCQRQRTSTRRCTTRSASARSRRSIPA